MIWKTIGVYRYATRDEDRLILDKLSAQSTKEHPATAFVQLKSDGEN